MLRASYIQGYICLRNPLNLCLFPVYSNCNDIEYTFKVPAWKPLCGVEITQGCFYYLFLFCSVDIFLRWSLYAFLAGLYFYKMYSVRIDGNNVNFQMSVSPVAFENRVSHALEMPAGQFFPSFP